jgi:hypothetical protein
VSWGFSIHEVFASLRDIAEKFRCGLEVPVAARGVAVTEVGCEGDNMTRDTVVVTGAIRQSLIGEVESQVMEPRERWSVPPNESEGPNESAKDAADRVFVEVPALS